MPLDIEWSDERTALAAAVLTIAIVSIVGSVLDVPFGLRTFVSVALGFLVLIIVSYYLTGSVLPPESAEAE